MDTFFSWMDENGYRYAVLRSFLTLAESYPARGDKRDIDIFVDDVAIGAIKARFGGITRRAGVKCDFYCARPGQGGDYLGVPEFPQELCRLILERRYKWRDRFFVPSAEDHYFSLLYAIAYHKTERSGIARDRAADSAASKYNAELDMLENALDIRTPRTLEDFHAALSARGYGVTEERLLRNIQHDFAIGRHSDFLAGLLSRQPEETCVLYLGPGAAARKLDSVLHVLQRRFRVLQIKKMTVGARLRHLLRARRYPLSARGAAIAIVFRAPVGQSAGFAAEMKNYFSWATRSRPRRWGITLVDGDKAVAYLPLHFTATEQRAFFGWD